MSIATAPPAHGPSGPFSSREGHYRKDSKRAASVSATMLFASSSTRTSVAPPTSSATRRRARRSWSIPHTRSSSISRRPTGHGVRIVRVLETHTHADHVSGHGRLALERGMPVSIHAEAGAEYPHDALADGDEVAAGAVAIRMLHTPGHRPEHCCFLGGRSALTGDSLFVGSVARPDLAVEAREGAEGLFHSLHRLLELPDDVRVFPGHVAGSLCGTRMSTDPSSTIGAERRRNPLLAIATVAEFVGESAGLRDSTAAEHGADRRAQPRAVRRRLAAARAGRDRRRRDRPRRPHRRGLRRRARAGGAERAGVGSRVRDEGRIRAAPRRADRPARLGAGRGGAGRAPAPRRRLARARGLPGRAEEIEALRARAGRRAGRTARAEARST